MKSCKQTEAVYMFNMNYINTSTHISLAEMRLNPPGVLKPTRGDILQKPFMGILREFPVFRDLYDYQRGEAPRVPTKAG